MAAVPPPPKIVFPFEKIHRLFIACVSGIRTDDTDLVHYPEILLV